MKLWINNFICISFEMSLQVHRTRPATLRASKIIDFFKVHFNVHVLDYSSPPLVGTFYACLTIISGCVPGESKTEYCIFDQYLSALSGHWTPGIPFTLIDFRCVFIRSTSIYPLPMMTSSNGNFFRVTGPLCGEFTGPGEFPTQRPVTRSFDVYFDLRPN